MHLAKLHKPSTHKARKVSYKVPRRAARKLYTHSHRSFNSEVQTPSSADPVTQRNMNRSSTSLYRDCLRLIDYMAGRSTKADRLRDIIRGEFLKNANETNPQRVEYLKGCAVQGLANYLTVESLARSGNKYTGPQVAQDQSLFARRKQLQQAEHGHDLSTLQEIEEDGPQEFRGVRITPGDFDGLDLSSVNNSNGDKSAI